jgi:hypothetical protein
MPIAAKKMIPISVRGNFGDDSHTGMYAIEKLAILDLDDQSFSTYCFWAFRCEGLVPQGHRVQISTISSAGHLITGAGIDSWVLATLIRGTSILTHSFTAEGLTAFSFVLGFTTANYGLSFSGSTKTELSYLRPADGGLYATHPDGRLILDSSPVTVPVEQALTIEPTRPTEKPLDWQGLPPGLKTGPDGIISGKPTKTGTFEILAKRGLYSDFGYYRFTLIVQSVLSAPSEIDLRSTGVDSASIQFSGSTGTGADEPDFYELWLTPTGSKSAVSKFFDGSAVEATIRGLQPDTTYSSKMRACMAMPKACSEWVNGAKFTTASLAVEPKSAATNVKIATTWDPQERDRLAIEVSGKNNSSLNISIFEGKNRKVAASVRKSFEATFRGLKISQSGQITGRLKTSTTKQSARTFAIEGMNVSFTFKAK